VVDTAVPPDKRSSPHRLLIVIGGTILAFLVAVFWILLRKRWASASGLPENRERLEAIKVRWNEKADTG
jgi:membrane-associated phospholipid phosphatase